MTFDRVTSLQSMIRPLLMSYMSAGCFAMVSAEKGGRFDSNRQMALGLESWISGAEQFVSES
jgi:hypothetical protein